MWLRRLFKPQSNLNILRTKKEEFIAILSTISNVLIDNNHSAQARVVDNLSSLIGRDEFDSFIKAINSVDMWGGSGAVWEVYIENLDMAREFEIKMLELICLMEETEIIGPGIKSLKQLFQRNLRN
ncbi:hypothetical protein ACFQZS_14715 [Mucilaginibacter calamicampi]|uniref:Uncharacterized protein n=1 Tax=Mucilaginibacter calamicampi TaxID=1302352 RepID=A0ABW2Z3W2_9SPHI